MNHLLLYGCRHELTVRVKWQFCHTRLILQDFTNVKVVVQTNCTKAVLLVPNQLARWIHLCIIGKVHDTKRIVVAQFAVLQLTVGIDFSTVIWFMVKVPVLSDAMISVEPCFNGWQFTNNRLRLARVVSKERTMISWQEVLLEWPQPQGLPQPSSLKWMFPTNEDTN